MKQFNQISVLKLLRSIIQAVNVEDNLENILSLIVERVRVGMRTHTCSIFLVEKSKSELVLRATDGWDLNAVNRVRIKLNHGLIGAVATRCEPINLDDAPDHPNDVKLPFIGKEQFKSFLGVPIQYHRQLLGVLVVQQKEARQYDETEEAFLVTLAVQLAGIIARSQMSGAINDKVTSGKKTLILRGLPGAPGVGIGQAQVICSPTDLVKIPDRIVEDVNDELIRFEAALTAAREEIKYLEKRLAVNLPSEEQVLFDAYLKILDSDNLIDEITQLIRAGSWAQGAVSRVMKNYIRQFETMENEYFRERAADLRDLGHRILNYLEEEEKKEKNFPKNTILISEEVSVSHLAEVPEGRLKGIVSAKGSSNSHVAILAHALGIPTVMGVGDLPVMRLQDKQVIVDGYSGRVLVSPQPKVLQAFKVLAREENELDAELQHLKELPAEAPDHHRIALYVNTGLMAGLERSLSIGAEGVGLYRTEMPFIMRDCFPSTQEQQTIYRRLLEAFAPQPVVMRVLDIGGDKTLPYFPITESNPFLGWRGIRVLLDQPEIFSGQLRAMLQASEGLNNLSIMLPMICDVSEVIEAKKIIEKVYQEILEEGLSIQLPKIGVMIEVPSAVYQADALAKQVDFLSVGSNDLTQYLLAVDRNNEHVANLYSGLHPTVLKALIQIVKAAHAVKKPVSICGEMAGDPASVILLIAMGFDSLSMSAGNLLRAKWVVRTLPYRRTKELLKEVLTMDDAKKIRKYLEKALSKAGLGGLVRPGRR